MGRKSPTNSATAPLLAVAAWFRRFCVCGGVSGLHVACWSTCAGVPGAGADSLSVVSMCVSGCSLVGMQELFTLLNEY